ncbi:MAG: AMP-dependent synthetase, partial [Verrucomicrobiota bacterium]
PYTSILTEDREAMRAGKGLLTGKPVGEINLAIIRDQWSDPIQPLTTASFASMENDPGEPGEIVVSGDHVLDSYLHGKGNEETKFTVDHQVWHRTGDAGYLDSQGRLWLLGRCAARIEDERGTLFPFAAETALSFVPEVIRCAAVQINGARVLALELTNSSDQTMATIKATVAWAHFNDFRTVNSIPVDRRHNAKIDYPALRSILTKTSSN